MQVRTVSGLFEAVGWIVVRGENFNAMAALLQTKELRPQPVSPHRLQCGIV